MQASFAKAKANGDAGLMIIGQADPGFDKSGAPYTSSGPDAPTRDPVTLDFAGTINEAKSPGFKDFLLALRNGSIGFGKPVVYVHGDTHYFRIDKPLLDKDGKRLENFTRVETFGDNAVNGLNDVHWVKALVDPQSRDVFAFQAQTVPGNVVAHTVCRSEPGVGSAPGSPTRSSRLEVRRRSLDVSRNGSTTCASVSSFSGADSRPRLLFPT